MAIQLMTNKTTLEHIKVFFIIITCNFASTLILAANTWDEPRGYGFNMPPITRT
jgi:hypothetical protein